MRPSFFVFSLPRSGSAWLSVFLSGADSFCYHEPTADQTPQDWVKEAAKRPESIVGAVDTGAYRFASLVERALPVGQFFVLIRDPDEVAASLRKQRMVGFDTPNEFSRLLRLPYKHIHYAKLGDLAYLEKLWGSIVGTKFDPVRAKQLIEMNVQRDVRQFMANRPDIHSHYRRLLA